MVGIAAFVAAVWIATSVASLDRSEKSVVPAGTGPVQTGPVETGPTETRPVAETGPTETGPAESAPVPALASGAPHVVRQGRCSDAAKSQLALTDLGRRILVRFELHRSPVGHTWRIEIHHGGGIMGPNFVLAFAGIRVAGDSGDFSVQLPTPDRFHSGTCGGFGCPADWFKARATDMQTDQPLQGVGPNRVTAPAGARAPTGSSTEGRLSPRARAVHPAASREPAPHGEPAV